jgi:hypothetical protein
MSTPPHFQVVTSPSILQFELESKTVSPDFLSGNTPSFDMPSVDPSDNAEHMELKSSRAPGERGGKAVPSKSRILFLSRS